MTFVNPQDHYEAGVALAESGKYEQAIDAFRSALELDPDMSRARYGLGVSLRHAGRLEEAIRVLQGLRVSAEAGDNIDLELGLALLKAGQYKRAAYLLEKYQERSPESCPVHIALGDAFTGLGDNERALEAYRGAMRLACDDPGHFINTGQGFMRLGMFDMALESFSKAAKLSPDDALISTCIGDCYYHARQYDKAITAYQQAIEYNPRTLEAYNNLGNIYQGMLELDKALEMYRRALSIRPDMAELHTNIGNVLMELGDPLRAMESYRTALQYRPGYALGRSNLAMSLVYQPDSSEADILEEHIKWARECCGRLQTSPVFTNSCDSVRRLRIGYLSPNFYFHPVTSFFWPMVAESDRNTIETFCYSDSRAVDNVTQRIRQRADHWRDTVDMSDAALEQVIRNDRIDILVELAGHTAGNRLRLLARRVAPVQVSYLGYPCTTGLPQMDYYITDKLVDPEGSEAFYSEKLAYIPVFSCYQPCTETIMAGPLPFLRNGRITFASLNNPRKFHDELIALWSDVLSSVADSVLVMQGKGFKNEGVIRHFAEKFAHHGINRDRLVFHPPMPFEDHLRLYRDIDIALDTYPWNGHTTSCHALWMGCPVIAMLGKRHASRMAGSVLMNIGHGELVASSEDEYVDIAVRLAADTERLSTLRASLRDRMRESPLCDGKTFQNELENVYQDMWKAWCAGK